MADLNNREFSQEERERLAEEGKALPDGSFPIVTKEDLENAIQSIGRAKDPAEAKRHIKKRARELGHEDLIPEEWNMMERPAFRSTRPLAEMRSGKGDWYRISNKGGETPSIYIYDEIGFFGVTSSQFVDDLNAIDSDALDVHVNSPGGDVFDGLAIYQALKNHKAKVTLTVDALGASIASVIAMAADTVIMAPKATLMIHDGFTMAVGNAADLRKTADLLDKISNTIASVYAEKAGGDVENWRNLMREETWFSAEEALEAGLADEIQGRAKERNSFDLSVFDYAGRENAPTPELKVKAKEEKQKKKEEGPTFQWDFESFRNALKEGMNV